MTTNEPKTIGQIAYEAHAEANGSIQAWAQANQPHWSQIAYAVANAVADEARRYSDSVICDARRDLSIAIAERDKARAEVECLTQRLNKTGDQRDKCNERSQTHARHLYQSD